MLRVRVELVPYGIEEGAQVLSEVCIGNDGTGGREIGNYDVYFGDPRQHDVPRAERPGYIGRIEGLARHGEDRSRDRLASLALDLARGQWFSARVDRTEQWDRDPVKLVPMGWVVMRNGKRTHFLGRDGRSLCKTFNASDVFCREGEMSPARCKSCARHFE